MGVNEYLSSPFVWGKKKLYKFTQSSYPCTVYRVISSQSVPSASEKQMLFLDLHIGKGEKQEYLLRLTLLACYLHRALNTFCGFTAHLVKLNEKIGKSKLISYLLLVWALFV